MLKAFVNLKVILIITAIVIGTLGTNLFLLKNELSALSLKNDSLKKENLTLSSVYQANLITIESLQIELHSLNQISAQQAIEFSRVETLISTDKQTLKIDLKAEADEKNIQWADNSLPDSVAIMLNNTRNNHSNKSGSHLPARNPDQRYTNTNISRKNKPRSS